MQFTELQRSKLRIPELELQLLYSLIPFQEETLLKSLFQSEAGYCAIKQLSCEKYQKYPSY